jgi:tetratricopeptide (TPR) repeat protein
MEHAVESQPNLNTTNPLASCQVCGRRDETVRAVVFPFVISLLFVTFRRYFAGVWCRRHRRRYLFFSSFITAGLGWLGIPYGFFYTPLTLWKLARGGDLNRELTAQLLNNIGEERLLANDPQGSIRCFEESLRIQDSPQVKEKLARLYLQQRPVQQQGLFSALAQFLAVPLLLLIAVLTGLTIGIADVMLTYLLTPIFGSTESLILVIVSWLPLVIMIFMGVLIVRSRLEWTLKQVHSTNKALALSLAVFASLFAFYSSLEGRAIINSLPYLVANFSISKHDLLFTLRGTLAYGGIMELVNFIGSQQVYGIIYLVLFGAGAAVTLYTAMETAHVITDWLATLAKIRGSVGVESEGSLSLAWIWLAGIVSAVLLFNLILFPGKFTNVEKANELISTASFALDNNDQEAALSALQQANAIWPDNVRGHSTLGLLYLDRNEYELARAEGEAAIGIDPNSLIANVLMGFVNMSEFEFEKAIASMQTVSAAQPNWALPHAYLAVFYYITGRQELEIQEVQKALAFEEGDGQASAILASYYFGKRELQEAEKHLFTAIESPNVSADEYFLLASIYLAEDKFDLASQAIDKAGDLKAEEVDVHSARSDLFLYQGDLAGALSEITQGLESAPENSEALASLSFIHFQQGKIDEAARDAERALEFDPYNGHAYIEQAFAYHAQGKLPEALALAEKAVKYAPMTDRAHYILGLAYRDSGRKEEAIQEFERFLELYWDRPLAVQYKEKAEAYLKELKK